MQHYTHNVKISALGCYAPPRLLTNHDLEQMVGTTASGSWSVRASAAGIWQSYRDGHIRPGHRSG